jgi:hypothetical protein
MPETSLISLPPQFTKMSGIRWEMVPLVPYESYAEYQVLVNDVIEGYSKMIKDSFEYTEIDLSSMSSYGLSLDLKYHWNKQGSNLLLKLTKGEGVEWCKLVNACLVDGLSTSVRVFVGYSIQFPASGFDEVKLSITSLLQREINFFTCNRNFNPIGYHIFHHVNFIYYRSSSDDLGSFDAFLMPTSMFRSIIIAFAMGTHSRLGTVDCVVGVLSDNLLRLIFSYGVF